MDNLYIIKFIFNARETAYYIVVGDEYVPVTYNAKLVLFDVYGINEILKSLDVNTLFCDGDESLTCNLIQCQEMIATENWDIDSQLLHTINSIDDVLLATNNHVDEDTKRILYDFADHITFNREFEVGFMKPTGLSRSTLLKCFLSLEQKLYEVLGSYSLDDSMILALVGKIKMLLLA